MSEEKFNGIIQEIKEIYLFLTQQEPTPDDEIEAREKLLEKVTTLKTGNYIQIGANTHLLETSLSALENWDTLELWFIESELPELIQKIINISENSIKEQTQEEVKEEIASPPISPLEVEKVNINEIVDKVSEQFKGEIDGLKQKIDLLEHELEKKDDAIQQTSSKRVIKKIIPKKNVKLPPPIIRIPAIKAPKKAPQIKIPDRSKVEKPKKDFGLKSIGKVQAKIEEELQKLKTSPLLPEEARENEENFKETNSFHDILEESKPLSPLPKLNINSEPPKEPASILDILEESGLSIPPPSPPEPDLAKETPKEIDSILEILEESGFSIPPPSPPEPDLAKETPKEIDSILEILEEKSKSHSPPLISDITPKTSDPFKKFEPLPPPPEPVFTPESLKDSTSTSDLFKKFEPLPLPPKPDITSETVSAFKKLEPGRPASEPLPLPPKPDITLETVEKPALSLNAFKKLEPGQPTFESLPLPPKSASTSETVEKPALGLNTFKKLEPEQPTSESDIVLEMPDEPDLISDLLDKLEPLTPDLESEYSSELPDNMPRLGESDESQSIKETPESPKQPIEFPVPRVIPEMPEELKNKRLIAEVTLIEKDTSNKRNFVPFIAKKPKITSMSVEEIESESESVKSSGTDLYNVFSSVGDTKIEKTIKNAEPFTPFTTSPPIITKSKKTNKKKKKEGKEEKGEELKKETTPFAEFSIPKPKPDISDEPQSFSIEELPKDKDSLYQELIALEGRRYKFEKDFKEIEKSFNTGSLSDLEYNKRNNEANHKLEEITTRINRIRRLISSL